VREPRYAASPDRLIRQVVQDVAAHIDAVQPAPDQGSQPEKKDWDERGKAIPRKGTDQLSIKGYRNSTMSRGPFLLIGADGLVGRHLSVALPVEDTVRTYRRDPPENGVVLDITEADAVRATIARVQPRVVFLAAADAFVERCEREPEATRQVNVEAPRRISELIAHTGALLVVFSSEYVFDGTAGAYGENDAPRPLNEYGRQKAALEEIALAGQGLVCRTSGVFGNDPKRKNFVYQLLDRLRAGKTFDVPSDQLVTPTYAPSLARAVVKLAEQGRTGVYHVAGPEVMGRVEFAQLVANAFRLDPSLLRPRTSAEMKLSAARPERAGLRTEKLRQELGESLTASAVALREMAI
jgi:dTDP-4-dehydrorhamnose reductase